MKPIYAAALLALGSGACAEDSPTLQLFQATPPDASCNIPATGGGLLRGALDTSFTTNYLMGFQVRTTLSSNPTTVGDTPVDSANALAIYVTEMEVSYRTEPDIDLDSATVPIYAVYPAGTQGSIVLPLLTTEAQAALATATGAGQVVELIATVRLVGETATGSDVESNEVAYPLTVFRSGKSCPSGQQPGPSTGPCDPRGQNGNEPACVAIPTTPP